MAIQTYKQWVNKHFSPDGSDFISGKLAEDGYAWYLACQLGRIPKIKEVKEYGKIRQLTTE